MLRLSEQGLSIAEIAEKCDRGEKTVRRHLAPLESGPGGARPKPTELVDVRQLVRNLQSELDSISPNALLRNWLATASEEAVSGFMTTNEAKEVYVKARRHHFAVQEPSLFLQVETNPVFSSLRGRFPSSPVWNALDECKQQVVAYLDAYFDMVFHIESCVEAVAVSEFREQGVADGNLWIAIGRHRMMRALAVLMTCDLLALGLSELPGDVRWGALIGELERLRATASLELASLTQGTQKKGWASDAERLWNDFADPLNVVQKVRSYLEELAKLRSLRDSAEMGLLRIEK